MRSKSNPKSQQFIDYIKKKYSNLLSNPIGYSTNSKASFLKPIYNKNIRFDFYSSSSISLYPNSVSCMLNTKKIIDECHQSVQSTVATKSILTDKRDTFDNITAIEEPEEIIQIQLNIDKQSSTHKKYIESILDKPLTDKYETTIALTNNYDKPRKLTYHYDTLTVPHRFHSRETPFKKILHERKNYLDQGSSLDAKKLYTVGKNPQQIQLGSYLSEDQKKRASLSKLYKEKNKQSINNVQRAIETIKKTLKMCPVRAK